MRRKFAAWFLVVFAALLPAWSFGQQVVFVVRHVERLDNSADPGLSVTGEARAQKLAGLLSATALRAIYTTQYQRTLFTGAAVGKQFGLMPVAVPAKEMDALLAKIRSHGKDEAVLVVGHSNTVPAILKGLGYPVEIKIAEEEHDNLFIVVPQGSAPPVVTRIKY
ncbi:MAG: histidine phosphatase family protein [Betaproteobacteria bacterium]|nr:histidine phosphatase family protein [Betaproteobacteria bacterium]